jgi:hypothetical protein
VSVVRAVVLGIAATAVLAYVFAGAVALVFAAGGGHAHVALGPLLIVEVSNGDEGSAVGLGSGLLVVALLGGVLNGAAGLVLRRRS